MAMGQQKDRQGDLMVSWSEMPRSPGHVFYDRLQLVLPRSRAASTAWLPPIKMGAPSVPPGRLPYALVGSSRVSTLSWAGTSLGQHSWLSRTRPMKSTRRCLLQLVGLPSTDLSENQMGFEKQQRYSLSWRILPWLSSSGDINNHQDTPPSFQRTSDTCFTSPATTYRC